MKIWKLDHIVNLKNQVQFELNWMLKHGGRTMRPRQIEVLRIRLRNLKQIIERSVKSE